MFRIDNCNLDKDKSIIQVQVKNVFISSASVCHWKESPLIHQKSLYFLVPLFGGLKLELWENPKYKIIELAHQSEIYWRYKGQSPNCLYIL